MVLQVKKCFFYATRLSQLEHLTRVVLRNTSLPSVPKVERTRHPTQPSRSFVACPILNQPRRWRFYSEVKGGYVMSFHCSRPDALLRLIQHNMQQELEE